MLLSWENNIALCYDNDKNNWRSWKNKINKLSENNICYVEMMT